MHFGNDIKKELDCFYKFLFFKVNIFKDKKTITYNWKIVGKTVLFSLINHITGLLIYLGLILILNQLLKLGLPKSIPFERININETDPELSIIVSFIIFVFCAPIVEELSFRFPLILKRYSISVALCAYMLSMLFFTKMASLKIASGEFIEYTISRGESLLLLLGLIVGISIFFHFTSEKIILKLKLLFNNYGTLIIIIISSYFAFSHALLPIKWVNMPWIIAMIFPHFYSGLTYSFLRVRYNTVISILCHAVWNLFTFLPVFIKMIEK